MQGAKQWGFRKAFLFQIKEDETVQVFHFGLIVSLQREEGRVINKIMEKREGKSGHQPHLCTRCGKSAIQL